MAHLLSSPQAADSNPQTVPTAAAVDGELAALDDPQEQGDFTTWRISGDGTRSAVSQFRLSGMYCAACAGLIEAALMRQAGVLEARVNASAERAEVRWDPGRTRPSALVRTVRSAGYDAAPDTAAPGRALRQREQRRALWRLFVAGFCMMQVMMYAAPSYVVAQGEIPDDLLRLLQWASWLLSLPVLLFSAGPFFSGAWRAISRRRIGMDVPVALGLAVTFVASTGATFEPGGVFGHEVYFDSLTMFVFFLLGGRYLEMRARHRAAASLEATLARPPASVRRVGAGGIVTRVSPRQLRVGDHVQVLAGEAFAADGRLIEGRCQVDEALLTGESMPVAKAPGDALVAGSLNLSAPVVMAVERVGADTRHAAIVSLMREALTQRPALVRAIDRWAGPFLWGVLLLAGGAALAWSVLDPSRAVWVAVAVLIVTCPCALSLAAPSALLAATGALARKGVLLRRLDALEALARADHVMFDKTGTLTEDTLALQSIELQAAANDRGLDAGAVLAYAASLAALSRHPASRALSAAQPRGPEAGTRWHDAVELPGAGVSAKAPDGQAFRLGARRWVCARPELAMHEGGGRTEVWFGPAQTPWACFVLAESPRADAQATVQRLCAEGVRVSMLSGDRPARAQALASNLGIDTVHAGATPEDKLAAVAAAQAAGDCVVMVGDGLNDAPVLARADVSFAFAHGAAVSQAHADAVLLSNRLADVADARRIARRAMSVMRQNMAWAVGYNLSCIPLALAGWLPPWAAGLGMALSSVLVILNSLRAGRAP